MNEVSGVGPETLGTCHRSNRIDRINLVGKTIWPFSARHYRLNAKRRRLISRYPNASLSYGKSERDLDLPEAAGRRAEGRVRGKSERSERNDGVRCCAGWSR